METFNRMGRVKPGDEVEILQWRLSESERRTFTVTATSETKIDRDGIATFDYEMEDLLPGAIWPGYAIWNPDEGRWEDGEM